MKRQAAAFLLMTVLAAACSQKLPGPPRPLKITPASGRPGVETPVDIEGENFYPTLRISYDDSSRSFLRTDFRAFLGEYELLHVEYRSDRLLRAVVAASLAEGLYHLKLIDPEGRQGVLERAFRVAAGACRSDDDCRDPCRSQNACRDGVCVEAAVDRDLDRDGYIDVTCPSGNDCEDDPQGCGAACHPGASEICDLYDNDCDPTTPDGAGDPRLGEPCDGPDRDLCPDDIQKSCSEGLLACSSGEDNLDLCDGEDNDCDPTTPDGAGDPRLGEPCEGPDGDLCPDDLYQDCAQGVMICSTGPDDLEGPASDASCTDGVDNDCDGYTDGADPGCSGNTPPLAAFSVAPALAGLGDTVVLDASACRDREDPPEQLQVRWDFESDGVWDTGFSLQKTESRVFSAAGTVVITLQVRDRGGLSGYTSRTLVVQEASATLVVTTAQDENDSGATVQNPGGTGLSLREAINIANASAGMQAIGFIGPMTISLASGLPALSDAAGAKIVGQPGVMLDGGGITGNQTCLQLNSTKNELHYLQVANCPSWAVGIYAASNRMAHCYLHDNKIGVQANGTDTVVGPGNRFEGKAQEALRLGAAVQVLGNVFVRNQTGIYLMQGASGSVISGNFFLSQSQAGVGSATNASGLKFWHNTFDGNGASGLNLPNQVNLVEVRNNLFTGNSPFGIEGGAATFSALDHNGFYGNATADCSECVPGEGTVVADPRYLDRATEDLRLAPQSPMIDRGADLGLDVNGPADGYFNGPAPDIGAWESP